MIIIKAPLRISFVGGGSDLPDFYHQHPGKVISVSIDKYVYVTLNPAPLLKGISAHYSEVEHVNDVKDLKNNRIRESMLLLGVKDNMEIGIFAHLPVGVGLGGSSSFTVALIKGFSTYLGQRLDPIEIAEMACDVEINRIKEPIGKQDQYAAAFGGLNVFQFNSDESVDVEPVLLGYKRMIDLQNQMLLFFTGITRQASVILSDQKAKISSNTETLKSMVQLVDEFRVKIHKGKFEALGDLLHQNWLNKKKLSAKISNREIDQLYKSGIKAGAWGGKVLGAGGGGCILFLAPSAKLSKVRKALKRQAQELNLSDFKEVPIKLVQSGVEIVSNSLFK